MPRSLDVIFNSIEDRQWPDMSLKPKLFQDVSKLTEKQIEAEQKVKDGVLKMALSHEVSPSHL